MTQTRYVMGELQKLDASLTFEIIPIVTKGDQILDVTLSKVGGKGLFVSEIEQALLDGHADIAVHSMKDVPYELAEGLIIAGIPAREDARDVLISAVAPSLEQLPHGARVGTSSLRRMAQLMMVRPDVVVEPLRGNIDTRLKRAEAGDFDAIILAAAGLHRMGWKSRITEYLSPQVCLPAVGQGILGIECRAEDTAVVDLLKSWSDANTTLAAQAERALLKSLEGSCQVPIAGYATILSDGQIELTGLVAHPEGRAVLQSRRVGTHPETLGRELAEHLISEGADEWIAMARANEEHV